MRYKMCQCRGCKRAARKGLWLGQKREVLYLKNWIADTYYRWEGYVDEYVPCPHMQKGKRVRRPKNKKIYMED